MGCGQSSQAIEKEGSKTNNRVLSFASTEQMSNLLQVTNENKKTDKATNQAKDIEKSTNQAKDIEKSTNQQQDTQESPDHIKYTSKNSSNHTIEGQKGKENSALTAHNNISRRETVPLKKMVEVNRWQDVDIAKLMEGVSLEDKTTVWPDYVDRIRVKSDPKIVSETQRKTWKTVRLFVSSTFKDMSSERDHLVKIVFPQLRQWCEERKLRLVECDLRWGVPKDADTREILLACLSEIDRCREENTYPYFLNILSERYGWVPEYSEVPDDIKARYKWIPGLSATSWEIFVGAYWDRNPHALFMFRKPDFLYKCRENVLKVYTEKEADKKSSLEILKGKLREKFPRQVIEYSCSVEKEEEDRVILTDLEDMGNDVLRHFKSMLEYQYPAGNIGSEPTLAESLHLEHETFMTQRSQVLLGRETDVTKMMQYVSNNVENSVPLVLVGFPGAGKSALAAYAIKQFLQESKYKVFYHFIGSTPRSTDLYNILARVFMEFMPVEEKMPVDIEEMKRFSQTMFQKATESILAEGYEKFVIVIDALNQMDDDGDAHYLGWLPQGPLPRGMRLIVSTLEGKCLNSLRDNATKPVELSVEPLDTIIRKDIIRKILAEYNKKLDDEQVKVLIDKEDSGRPLWLTIACEELRVFGDFRKLTEKIRLLPGDMMGLLENVLNRIIIEYGGDLVVATLCLVEISRFGLLETELLDLLAIQPLIPGQSSQKKVDYLSIDGKLLMAKWALVYLGLRQFLRPCGSSGQGRLDFHHRTISKVVRKMFLQKNTQEIQWHLRLSDYFQTCTNIERKSEELPYHLEMAEDREQLKTTLLSQDMFSELYKESNKQQLMRYWRFIGGYNIAAEEYVRALKQFIQNNGWTITDHLDEISPLQTKIAWFLIDIGEYDTAKTLLEEVLGLLSSRHGETAKALADPSHAMVFLLYRKALTYVYGVHPGYKECYSFGKEYGELCAEIHRKHFPKMDNHRGHVLTCCGYFGATHFLNEAKEIFETTGDKQGLAQVLYMLGEKNQYHDDMSVPIQYYTRSLALCMSTFGKYHLHTARCSQLFGQLYWNQHVARENRKDWLETCLELYKTELEILEEILGPLHPTTVRSREDVIIILDRLDRSEEAKLYQEKQPAEHGAL
ncbi:hypothetical protein ACJMK2_024304 [Sinanodonta woodiana]|uniref:Uncharacterized protein n=1 Tax=Sinanodonta woodiana TaxID=1069815 RepID=A0ABD3T6Y3_SINWO